MSSGASEGKAAIALPVALAVFIFYKTNNYALSF
jgi:hypothetical protein